MRCRPELLPTMCDICNKRALIVGTLALHMRSSYALHIKWFYGWTFKPNLGLQS